MVETKVVSVIIPVYNDLPGLIKTVHSMMMQSFKGFEIIIVNDGSDKSIADFCTTNNLHVINIFPNRGSYNARNEGIKVAKSDYLAFTDADLHAGEEWLAKGVEYLEKYDYIAGNVLVDETLIVDVATYHDYVTAFPIQNYFNKYHFGVTANLFAKRQVFERVGLFDSALKSGGDMEFGDRVYRGGVPQFYASDCIVIHPPRSHFEKKIKIDRVRKGQIDLFNKYPNRFPFFRKRLHLKQVLADIAPPKWSSVRKIYDENFPYSKWEIYWYLLNLKMIRFYNYYISR